jgi:hypothetical protein
MLVGLIRWSGRQLDRMVVALLGLRLDNLYFSAIIHEAKFNKFVIHQSQAWFYGVPRQVDVLAPR